MQVFFFFIYRRDTGQRQQKSNIKMKNTEMPVPIRLSISWFLSFLPCFSSSHDLRQWQFIVTNRARRYRVVSFFPSVVVTVNEVFPWPLFHASCFPSNYDLRQQRFFLSFHSVSPLLCVCGDTVNGFYFSEHFLPCLFLSHAWKRKSADKVPLTLPLLRWFAITDSTVRIVCMDAVMEREEEVILFTYYFSVT